MKGTWSPSVLLAVWGALGKPGSATKELVARDVKVVDSVPSAEDFVRRRCHTAAVIGDYLYIDGGQLIERVNGSKPANSPAVEVGTTWSIDLSKSWTNETVKIKSIPKQSPSLSRQTHWVDGSTKSLYTWGGFTSDDSSPKQELWRLATDGSGGGSWSQVTQRDFLAFAKLKGNFGTAFTQSPDAGYAFGGAVTHASDGSVTKELPGYATPGLVSYDFQTGEWGNSSSAAYGGYGTSLNARAEYVPFGPNGLIVFLGGAETPVDATNETMVEVNWNTITMVDPVTNTWYKQTTSGSKPPTVESHCSVGVAGPNGTYEIFMYGGVSDQLRSTSSDVYVLSLPGFVFFEGPRDAPSRSDHQCAVVGKGQRQMLSSGGIDGENRTFAAPTTADPWKYGLGILDMTELKWKDSYDADAPNYDSPAPVKAWYEKGNLQHVNWDSKGLADIFAKEEPPQNATPTPPAGQPGSGTTPTAAIAGGVVGGIVAIAAIGLLIFLLRRRKRLAKRPDTSSSHHHLAQTSSSPALSVHYKPEPLPKDAHLSRHYPYSPSSLNSPVTYTSSIARTDSVMDPHDCGTWRSELPANESTLQVPAAQEGLEPVNGTELPCLQPRAVSEIVKTSPETVHELPVPIEPPRAELPDKNYSE